MSFFSNIFKGFTTNMYSRNSFDSASARAEKSSYQYKGYVSEEYPVFNKPQYAIRYVDGAIRYFDVSKETRSKHQGFWSGLVKECLLASLVPAGIVGYSAYRYSNQGQGRGFPWEKIALTCIPPLAIALLGGAMVAQSEKSAWNDEIGSVSLKRKLVGDPESGFTDVQQNDWKGTIATPSEVCSIWNSQLRYFIALNQKMRGPFNYSEASAFYQKVFSALPLTDRAIHYASPVLADELRRPSKQFERARTLYETICQAGTLKRKLLKKEAEIALSKLNQTDRINSGAGAVVQGYTQSELERREERALEELRQEREREIDALLLQEIEPGGNPNIRTVTQREIDTIEENYNLLEQAIQREYEKLKLGSALTCGMVESVAHSAVESQKEQLEKSLNKALSDSRKGEVNQIRTGCQETLDDIFVQLATMQAPGDIPFSKERSQ